MFFWQLSLAGVVSVQWKSVVGWKVLHECRGHPYYDAWMLVGCDQPPMADRGGAELMQETFRGLGGQPVCPESHHRSVSHSFLGV